MNKKTFLILFISYFTVLQVTVIVVATWNQQLRKTIETVKAINTQTYYTLSIEKSLFDQCKWNNDKGVRFTIVPNK